MKTPHALAVALLALGPAGCDGGASSNADGGDAEAIPCPPSGISKGPWSLAMADTSIVVRWEACAPGTPAGLLYSPEGTGATIKVDAIETAATIDQTYSPILNGVIPDYAGTWYMHEARIAGLTPGTCYRYSLAADPSLTGRFCTAHASGDAIRFMVIGDTDANLGTFTRDVLAHTLSRNPEFILHGGDIEYYADPFETWASWFPVMAPLLRQGAMMPSLGNHEYEAKNDAGVSTEYGDYTTRYFGGAGFDGTGDYYRFSSGGVWFFMIDTEDAMDLGSPQGTWLVSSLADAAARPGFRFSVVVMHRPFLTCGDTDAHPDWLAAYAPYFDQYVVPLVIQAHMHGYERFEVGSRTFVTSAGGGGVITDVNQNVARPYCNQRVASGPYYHAMIFDLAPGMLSAVAIDDSGNVVDKFDKPVP